MYQSTALLVFWVVLFRWDESDDEKISDHFKDIEDWDRKASYERWQLECEEKRALEQQEAGDGEADAIKDSAVEEEKQSAVDIVDHDTAVVLQGDVDTAQSGYIVERLKRT